MIKHNTKPYQNAARALFGSEAEKEKNQQLSRSVALLLGQKLLAVGVFRQVGAHDVCAWVGVDVGSYPSYLNVISRFLICT